MDQMPPSVHLLSGLPPGIHAALSGMLRGPIPLGYLTIFPRFRKCVPASSATALPRAR